MATPPAARWPARRRGVVVVQQLLDLAEWISTRAIATSSSAARIAGTMTAGRSSFRRGASCASACPRRGCGDGDRGCGALVVGRRFDAQSVGQRPREVHATVEPVLGVLRERLAQNRIERRQLGTPVGKGRRRRGEVLADDHRRIGMVKRRRSRQQVKCGRCQRVLVRAAVELLAHQLFGSGVEHRADRHVGRSEVAGVVDPSSNTEVAQQNSLFTRFGVGHHDVGGLDVTMQETALMRVVEGFADGGDDVEYCFLRHPVRVAVAQQFGGVRPVHVVHRDPDLAAHVAAVVDTDDVRMPQRRGDVGFTVEPLPVLIVGAHVGRQHLEGICRGRRGWSARYTSPMPPVPRSRTMV